MPPDPPHSVFLQDAPGIDEATPAGGAADMDALIREICPPGSEHSVAVFRWDRDANKYAYLYRQPVEGFTLDAVRDRGGAGKYNLRIMGPKGHHVKSLVVLLGEIAAGGQPKGNGTDPLAAALAELRVLVKQQGELLAALARTSSAPRAYGERDPIEMAIRLVEVMKPAHAPAAADPTAMLKTMIDVFERGVEIGTGRDGDSLASVVDKTFPPLLDLLSKSVANDRSRSVHALPASVTLDTGAAAGVRKVAHTPAPAAPTLLDQLRASAAKLVGLAVAGRDPNVYACVFLDQLPDAHVAELSALAKRDDFVTLSLGYFPETQGHEPWFTEFLSAVREQLVDPGGEEHVPADS